MLINYDVSFTKGHTKENQMKGYADREWLIEVRRLMILWDRSLYFILFSFLVGWFSSLIEV